MATMIQVEVSVAADNVEAKSWQYPMPLASFEAFLADAKTKADVAANGARHGYQLAEEQNAIVHMRELV